MAATDDLPDIVLDGDNLYREEQVSDLKTGAIRRLIPVGRDGSDDSDRATRYLGQASLMTQAGALPLNFELEADSLQAAIDAFPAAAKQALQEAIEEMERMRREQASNIMVPGQGGAPAGAAPSNGPPGFKL
ncbi:hypothetical protein GYB61_11440 [bacterium]|nr:hypothetical protein [bacterium]